MNRMKGPINAILLFVAESHELRSSYRSRVYQVAPKKATSDDPASRLLKEANSTTTDENELSRTFPGPSFMVGLELVTAMDGEINQREVGYVLFEELYRYLWQELPYKYQIEEVTIGNIEPLILEPVRMLRLLKVQEGYRHEYVVTASTEFATEVVPTEEEITEIVLSIELTPSEFQSSSDPVLSTTTTASMFSLSTSENALITPEEPVVPSEDIIDNSLIYLGSGMAALLALMAGGTYYHTELKRAMKKTGEDQPRAGKADETSSLDETAGLESGSAFPVSEKSLRGQGVLFVNSGSQSDCDESLVEERGFNDDVLSVLLPNRNVAHKVVKDVIGDFSCGGFGMPSINDSMPDEVEFEIAEKQKKTSRKLDIDSVMDDGDSEYEGRRKRRKDFRLKAKVVDEVVDNGMSCGFDYTNDTSRAIDTVIAESDSFSDEDRRSYKTRKSSKQRNSAKSVVLVPRVSKDSGRRKKQKPNRRRDFEDDIFSVVSDDSDAGGCESGACKGPREVADEVIEEMIDEAYDCGMTLVGK